jgi:hypothetical protein
MNRLKRIWQILLHGETDSEVELVKELEHAEGRFMLFDGLFVYDGMCPSEVFPGNTLSDVLQIQKVIAEHTLAVDHSRKSQ